MNNTQELSGYTYFVHAFGCQMNKHDAERVCGILDQLGANQSKTVADADIVVFLTCCVREAADTRLFGQLESIKNLPLRDGSVADKRIFGIGGCIAQRDGQTLLDKYPHIDVVVGTQKLSALKDMILDAAINGKRSAITPEKSDEFASDLPTKRELNYSAWLPITSGCNNFCSYCIVPYVRGREKSRSFDDIVAEASSLLADGVQEITLLGQNVNSYGRDLFGEPKFAELLKAVSDTGINRLRFLTSHPKDLNDEVIKSFADLKNVMPAIHLALQSGSDKVLHDMNRKYTSAHYMELIYKLREARPDIALSTDIIVGFPTEDASDFEQTYKFVNKVGYSSAFTFIYSKREGTPAAKMTPVSSDVEIHERFERLADAIALSANEYNKQFLNSTQRVLVEGPSKKDKSILTGKSEYNTLVHFPYSGNSTDIIGRIVDIDITETKTWYLSGKIINQ